MKRSKCIVSVLAVLLVVLVTATFFWMPYGVTATHLFALMHFGDSKTSDDIRAGDLFTIFMPAISLVFAGVICVSLSEIAFCIQDSTGARGTKKRKMLASERRIPQMKLTE